jgi:hypothetical protein
MALTTLAEVATILSATALVPLAVGAVKTLLRDRALTGLISACLKEQEAMRRRGGMSPTPVNCSFGTCRWDAALYGAQVGLFSSRSHNGTLEIRLRTLSDPTL